MVSTLQHNVGCMMQDLYDWLIFEDSALILEQLQSANLKRTPRSV